MSFTYIGLCSGIGMLERACELHGGEGVLMADFDPFCRDVLAKRYPGVPLVGDVTEIDADGLSADVMCFGFPCQDVSAAGKGVGMAGDRSGPVWSACFELVSKIRPKMVLIENVAMLVSRGLSQVIDDLASIGYDAEWDVISAAACGGAHLRERIFIIARPRELAGERVFSGEAKKQLAFGAKLTRAGRMAVDPFGGYDVWEMIPMAPKKMTRHEGWSYWSGVDLLGLDNLGNILLPTATASEYGSSQNGVNGKGGENDSFPDISSPMILPTPTATMGDRGGRGDLLQVVRGNESPSGHFSGNGLWPTPHGMSKEEYERFQGPSGNELGRAVNAVEGGERPMFGTPMAHERTHDPRPVHHGVALANQVADMTDGTLSAPMWPTPEASDASGGRIRRVEAGDKGTLYGPDGVKKSITLSTAVRAVDEGLWPTPQARDWKDSGPAQGNRKSANLGTEVHRREDQSLWPTPVTTDANGARNATVGRGNTGHDGKTLTDALILTGEIAHPLWPTPKAVVSGADYARAERANSGGDDLATRVARGQRGSLNPTWVEWLMGMPLWWTDVETPTPFTTQTPWWMESHIEKTTTGRTQSRKPRLKAIGNSVFWPCAWFVMGRALAATPAVGQPTEEEWWVI